MNECWAHVNQDEKSTLGGRTDEAYWGGGRGNKGDKLASEDEVKELTERMDETA